MKKMTQKLLACGFAAAVALSIGVPMTASADANTPTGLDESYLTKRFNIDANTTIPSETFKFTFSPVKVNEDAYDTANMPEIDDVEWLATEDTPTLGTVDATATDGTRIYTITLEDILTGVTFTHAGVYEYDVEEDTTAATAGMTYDTNKYKLRIYIENDGAGGLTDPVVMVERQANTTDDDDTNDAASKIDPVLNPGSGMSAFLFNNTYLVTEELSISKTVDGDTTDYGDLTRLFDFDLTLTGPTATPIEEDAEVIAKVYDAGGNLVVDATRTLTYTLTFDAANTANGTFQLKHGETLKFSLADSCTELPVGTTYELVETGVAGYTGSAMVATGGGTEAGAPVVAEGADLPIDLDECLISEGENYTDVTNTYKKVTPTGVLIDLLPYIVIIGLVIGGMFFMVAAKRRKATR